MTPTERKALSQQLRAERRQAVAERRRQEALRAPASPRPAPPARRTAPPAQERPRPPQRFLTGIWVQKPLTQPILAPCTCRRSRWRDYPPDSHGACPSGVNPGLHIAYEAWAAHHATCAVCSWADWYLPGGIKEVADKLLADFTQVFDGTPRYFRRGVDYTVLCVTGALLFQQWEREAARGSWTTAL